MARAAAGAAGRWLRADRQGQVRPRRESGGRDRDGVAHEQVALLAEAERGLEVLPPLPRSATIGVLPSASRTRSWVCAATGAGLGSLGSVLGRLGDLLGPLGAFRGRLGTEGSDCRFKLSLLDSSWGRLGTLLGRLGLLWVRLGALLGRFGALWGLLGPSWGDLWSLLGRFRPFLARQSEIPKNLQKPLKNQ